MNKAALKQRNMVFELRMARSMLGGAAIMIKDTLGKGDITDEYVRDIDALSERLGKTIEGMETPSTDK